MRLATALLLGSFVLVPCTAALADETDAQTEVDPETYRTAARSGIGAGVALEITGYAGILASLIVMRASENPDAGFTTMYVGGGVMVLGSLISSIGYYARHQAYLDAGLEPRPNYGLLSWLFTCASAAAYGVSLSIFVEHMQTDYEGWGGFADSLGNVLGMAMTMELAVLFSALSLGAFKSLWRRDMRRAEQAAGVSFDVHPMVFSAGAGPGRASAVGVAVSGTF